MFYNYRIVNDEKTLILYVDYLFEFGIDFNKRNKNINMKDEIKKIIKKINFTGEKVAIMVGGILLATILIVENPKVQDKLDLVYVSDNIFPITEIVDNNTDNGLYVVENVKSENSIEEKNVEIFEKKVEKSTKAPGVVVSYEEEKEKTNQVEKDSKNEISDEVMVNIYRKNSSIIKLELEEYLIGVVGAEMPASFDIEALKAQAIISRTYALKSIEMNRKLTDDVKTQAYKDNDELKKMWGNSYDMYYAKIKEAVLSTKGLAIYYDNNYIDAVFHSTSNGYTEDSKYVWESERPYLKSVDSSWDKESTSYLREDIRNLNDVMAILGIDSSEFHIISRNDSGRVLEIAIGDKKYSGVEFRNILGLRSADFDIEIFDNNIKFITRGYGHGVGLSQYGANGMAKEGYNYNQIIKHYYTNVEIK